MNRLGFYLQYAARNLWRNRRWSAFAMLSVAAGVATVVALRSLGLAIGDTLNSNVRNTNHGDITLERGSGAPVIFNTGEQDADDVFRTAELAQIREWVNGRDGQMTEYTFSSLQISGVGSAGAGALNFVTTLLIDPETYPPTDDIRAVAPEGATFSELFQGGAEVVVSENFAQQQGVGIGDEVRVSGTEQQFVVRGIIPTEAEAGLRDPFAAFFGFAYFDRTQPILPNVDIRPNRISLILPDGTSNEEISIAGRELEGIMRLARGQYRIRTVPDLIEQNAFIADITGRLVVVMGLGAMLLGGVGIINTMLVLVRRRTDEIAALKTFGLKGRQVALIFMTEGLVLGLIGSVIGAIVGALLSRFTNAYGATFIQQSVVWRLYPEAIVFGVVLGLVVTAVFGVMPVLTAVRVRPGIILRPNESHFPALGVLQSIGVTLFVVFALGLVAGQIIGRLPEGFPQLFGLPFPPNLVIGVIGVAITLVILALLVGLLWIVVWLVGKIPAFGWIDLRLALTNLRSRRIRTSTTLLAISVGMFALSSITFYGAGVRELLQFSLTETFGGNVVVFSPAFFSGVPAIVNNTQRELDNMLDDIEEVTYRTRLINYDGVLKAVDGTPLVGETFDEEQFQQEMRQATREGDLQRMGELTDTASNRFVNLSIRESDNPDLRQGTLTAGRRLTPEDRGQNVMLITAEPRFIQLGIGLGSEVTFEVRNRDITFTVVGMVADEANGTFEILIPPEALGSLQPEFLINTIYVEPEVMGDVLLEISETPGFYPLNVEFFDAVVSRLITQFSALPLLVGMLSLGAAAVIMANTVALATLERRKQIGILKAIGLKSRRVLSIMLLENTMVSLLGGILGIGLSALGVAALSFFGLEDIVLIPRDARPVAVALVITAALIGSVATFLSANVAVRERVLNVLRYE